MTVTPLDMPARRASAPVKVALPVRLAWVTETGDAPLPPKRATANARVATVLAGLERDGLLTRA